MEPIHHVVFYPLSRCGLRLNTDKHPLHCSYDIKKVNCKECLRNEICHNKNDFDELRERLIK